MKATFSAQQKRVLTICIVIYAAAYVCRLNLSAALSSMMQAMNLSMARGGMLQTVFAVIYAAGQFINGAIADRVNPVRYMLIGLAGSAASNLAMGLISAYPTLLAFWALNAVFQSMLWTPIMRLIALYFFDSASRERANMTISLMLIAGHFVAWAISGFVSAYAGWRFSFLIPALIAFAIIVLLLHMALSLDIRRQEEGAIARKAVQHSVMQVFFSTGFPLVIVTCVLYGFIRDSVVTWTPTILARMSQGDGVSSAAFTLILPVINVAGVLLGSFFSRRGARAHGVVAVMMIASVFCSTAMLGGRGLLFIAVLLGMICAAMYGANPALTGLIPLEYDRIGKTSLTAGLIDSFIYLGSALAGVAGGSIFEFMGSHMLYATWIAAGCVCAALLLLAMRMNTEYWKKHSL